MTEQVLLGVLVVKLLSLAKYIANWRTSKPEAVTLLSSMAVGVVVVALAAHAKLTEGLTLPPSTMPLGLLDFPSQVMLGVVAASLGSFGYDVKKAIDNSDSAAEPKLIRRPSR